MIKKILSIILVVIISQTSFAQDELLNTLKSEVDRNYGVLSKESVPAYYISYRVYDTDSYNINYNYGKKLMKDPIGVACSSLS